MMWVGPVSSAKSTGALGMAYRLTNQDRRVVLIRPARSLRVYEVEGTFLTKDGTPWPSFDITNIAQIDAILLREKPDVIWFDEPVLFPGETDPGSPPDLFEVVTKLRQHYMILVSGISATSELEVFGKSTPLLMATADEIIVCKGDCPWCGRINVGTRSVYVGDAPKTTKDKVGGVEMYQPACPECWNLVIRLPVGSRSPQEWAGYNEAGGEQWKPTFNAPSKT